MAQDASELVIAGSGDIAFAPVGTTLPTTPTGSLHANFVNAGYATEEGLTLSAEPSIEKHMAWQSRQAVRIELVGQEVKVGFGLEQWNSDNAVFAFGGGAVESLGGGVYKYTFPSADEALDERSLICDWQDGDKNYRLIIPNGNVTEGVEVNLTRGSLAVLPVTFEALDASGDGPGYILTDDPNWTAES